jgi:hypothetical protein
MNGQASKKCSKCGSVYTATPVNFYRDKNKKDGIAPSCRSCSLLTKRKSYKEVIAPRLKEERRLKREAIESTEEYKKQKLLAAEQSKQRRRDAKRRYAEKNREKLNEAARMRPRKPVTLEKRREYKKREYDKIKACPYKKFVLYSRIRVSAIINKNRKDKNFSVSEEILFTREELIKHIESMFKDGMTWDNYGRNGWHIDHIKPLASFDITKEGWVKEAFSLSNLQPLWAKDNLVKGSKYNKDGKDMSHTKSGKLVKEDQSKNRARNRGRK